MLTILAVAANRQSVEGGKGRDAVRVGWGAGADGGSSPVFPPAPAPSFDLQQGRGGDGGRSGVFDSGAVAVPRFSCQLDCDQRPITWAHCPSPLSHLPSPSLAFPPFLASAFDSRLWPLRSRTSFLPLSLDFPSKFARGR